MLNSGKKIALCATKKIIFQLLCCPKKNFWIIVGEVWLIIKKHQTFMYLSGIQWLWDDAYLISI